MRRVLLLCVLAAAGCESASRAPKFATREDNGTAGVTTPTPTVTAPKPDTSDPAAEQVVAGILLKHTQSEPKRLDALRSFVTRRKGSWNLGGQTTDATMLTHNVWPDQYRSRITLAVNGHRPQDTVLRGTVGSVVLPPSDRLELLDPARRDEVQADVWGDWAATLFPFAGGEWKAGPVPAGFPLADGETAARVWIADRSPVVLVTAPPAGYLGKVVYEVRESGRVTARTLLLKDHKPVAGVMLPTRIDFTQGPASGIVWTAIEYEVPAKIDPAIFEKP